VSAAETVIWHDLECGRYREDLELWAELADDSGGPILDVGAGTGRVSLELARRGHRVVAMDIDGDLLAALAQRAGALAGSAGLRVTAVVADARDFDLGEQRFALCLVPMQTIQLMDGVTGRRRFLARARAHLVPAGLLAIAIAPELEEFVWSEGTAMPLPDMVELEGTVYASQPTAVRVQAGQGILERRREVIDPAGGRRVSEDRIALDLLSAADLITDAVAAGLAAVGTRVVAETDEHVGSLVVIFRA
jgi:SAM-dependent methyltransferase